jgi:hypothetical protein
MRRTRPNVEDRGVGESHTHLSLELVRDGQEVSGRLVDGDGRAREFSGYAGLISVLETIRLEEATAAAAAKGGAQ